MRIPKISVIVPIYNVQQYLGECIESIRAQTYKNLQIILVDDGSTDLSGQICDKHALEDDRITVIHQENRGVGVTRKIGLKAADGEYIGFVDGDDYIKPQMYETMLHTLVRENADMVQMRIGAHNGCDAEVIDLNTYRNDVVKNFLGGKSRIDIPLLPSLWSKLFKRKIIKNAYELVEEDVSYGEDLVCTCAVLLMASKICIMDQNFYYYRNRENSITRSIDLSNVSREARLYLNVCNVLKRMNIYEELKSVMDSFLVRHIFGGINQLNKYDVIVPRYYFPSPEKIQNKKVLLYGAGAVGNDYYTQISRYTNCEIVAWVDAHPEKYNYSFVKLYGLDCLSTISYDILLIAIKKKEVYEQIEKSLLDRHISSEKIMWEKPKDIFCKE